MREKERAHLTRVVRSLTDVGGGARAPAGPPSPSLAVVAAVNDSNVSRTS